MPIPFLLKFMMSFLINCYFSYICIYMDVPNINCWVHIMLFGFVFSELTISHWTINQCVLPWGRTLLQFWVNSVVCNSMCNGKPFWVFPIHFEMFLVVMLISAHNKEATCVASENTILHRSPWYPVLHSFHSFFCNILWNFGVKRFLDISIRNGFHNSAFCLDVVYCSSLHILQSYLSLMGVMTTIICGDKGKCL